MCSFPSVLIVHNIPGGTGSDEHGNQSREGVLGEVRAVAAALREKNISYRIAGVTTLRDLGSVLNAAPERIVFNLVEELGGAAEDYDYVPLLCRALGKSSTGNDTPALLYSQDKWLCKQGFRSAGLLVPDAVVVQPGQPVSIPATLRGPFLVKPVATDASEGIDAAHVFSAAGPELDAAVVRLHQRFRMPVLVEQFVGHREFNVSLLERNGAVEVLPIAEIEFIDFPENKPRVVDYAAKWIIGSFEYDNTRRKIPAAVADAMAVELRKAALAAWHACGCRDYARVDVRMDEQGRVFVLEVNANPDVSPDAGFAAALQAGGIRYSEFATAMVENAVRRLDRTAVESAGEPLIHDGSITIRRSQHEDRAAILAFTEATGFFRPCEVTVAQEVLDDALLAGPSGHYQSFTCVQNGKAAGWVCFGPTPCTLGTFDIYWIVVAPDCQRQGIGRRLLQFAEERIREREGRLLVIETSGAELYHATRGFYLTLGFRESARIPDFYAANDARVVYTKAM